MSGLLDLLSSLGGGGGAPQGVQMNSTPLDIPPVPNQTPTTLSDITVSPTRQPPPASSAPPPPPQAGANTQAPQDSTLDYNNSQQVAAIHSALDASPPQGGSDNPGIYGLLPKNLQHGTLRNVLGAIGDAFLVGDGGQATYGPRMARQAEGNAMAGYAQNPQAAIERLAATGAPDAMKNSDGLETNLQNMKMRQAIAAQTQSYHDAETNDRNARAFQTQIPYAANMVAQAKTPADYQRIYSLLSSKAQSLDPKSDATQAYNLPAPEDWTPESTANYGLTANNQLVSNDKAAQRQQSNINNVRTTDTSRRDTDVTAAAHIKGDTIMANKPSSTSAFDQAEADLADGKDLSPAQKAIINHQTALRGRPQAGATQGNKVPITMAGNNNPVANVVNGQPQPVTPAQARTLPRGTHFLTSDGRWMIR